MPATLLAFFCSLIFAALTSAQPLSTSFTYQGRLDSANAPASGSFDFRFTLFDAAIAGTQLGPVLCVNNLAVTNGAFTVQLDFGAQFSGQQRFLDIGVRADTGLDCSNTTGFTTLSPRQNLTAAPNAVYSLSAASATSAASAANASLLNSQPAAYYTNAANLSTGALSDARLSTNVDLINTPQTIGALKSFAIPPAFTTLSGPPFTISSTTSLVPNLNSDMLGGLHSADFVQITGAQTISGAKSFAAAPAFTTASGSPFTIPTTTGLVTNLNADMVGGLHAANLVQTTGAQTIAGNKTFSGSTVLNGFVGLGTTTGIGAAILVVNQATTTFGGMYINTSSGGNPFYGYSQGGNIMAYSYIDGTDANKWKCFLNGGNRTTITGTGDVGIGTTSPLSHLTVSQEADTNCAIAINSGSSAAQISSLRLNDRNTTFWSLNKTATNDFTIRELGPNLDRLYIAQGGAVAIGSSTVNTSAQLDVTTTAPNAEAIVGFAQGSNVLGVFGDVTASAGTGVYGYAENAGGTTYGVVGRSDSASGFGVYSQGNFAATGTKSFQIDHPLDPQNKYLNHYCEEGPEPLNVYRGTITLDERGEATIDLPAYFSEINKDPSYTLTAVGSPMPALYISQEVAKNHFSIAGGVPNGKVCWRVEATRNDRFVKAHGAPVEQDKPAEKRGTYLQPALYSQPPEKSQFFRPTHRPAEHNAD